MSGRCRQFTLIPNTVLTRRKRSSNRVMTRFVRSAATLLLLSAVACDGKHGRAGSPVPVQGDSAAEPAPAELPQLLEKAQKATPGRDRGAARFEVFHLAAYEWTPEGYRWLGPLKP